MQKLLDEIYKIVLLERKEQREKLERGEYFNIFSILGLQTNEVRTHSAFVAELLNPHGTHGMKDIYLKLFLKNIDCLKDYAFTTKSAHVSIEESVGLINQDGTEGGRIDIIIRSGKKAIIIENKINAGDQGNQIVRYSNYANKFEDYRLLYLTLDGHEASEYSCADLSVDEDYFCISYEKDVLRWLEACIKKSESKPLVLNTIKQYSTLIKELTNRMSNQENEKSIMKILCSKDNVSKTAAILDMYHEIRDELLEQYFIKKIKEWARRNEYEYTDDVSDCMFNLHPNGWKHHSIALWVGRSQYDLGIRRDSGRVHKQIQLSVLTSGVNEGWPFGWERCTNQIDTFEMIVSGKALQYIKKTVNDIIDEMNDRKEELDSFNIIL